LRARFFKGEGVVTVRQHSMNHSQTEAGEKRGRRVGEDLPAAKG